MDAPETGKERNQLFSHSFLHAANGRLSQFEIVFCPEYDLRAMTPEIRLYLGFAVIKLIGYTFLCVILARYYRKSFPVGVAAGVVRTLIGMATGALLFYGIFYGIQSAATAGMSEKVRIALLAPVRVAEWSAVFWLFFGRPFQRPVFLPILGAIVWSFVLDVLGVFLLSGLIRGIIC